MPSSSTQAYVTLIFGDEAYVCAAAVLGAALRAIVEEPDPSARSKPAKGSFSL